MDINNMASSINLREYWYMALRHKLAFFLTTLLAVVIAASVAFSMPKIYRSESVLFIESEQILKPLISGLAISPSAMSRMRSMREQMLSWPKLTLLAEKMGLDRNIKSPVAYEKMISNLRSNIGMRLKGNSIISVSYEGANPQKAQEIVQTLTTIITDGAITSTNLEANSAIQFLEDQMEVYRERLEESESRLREFRELYNSTLPVATRMNEQLVQLKLQLSNLLVNNTEKHPRVIATREMIKTLESTRDVQMKKASEVGFDIGDETNFAQLVSSVPLQEQHLSKLQRDYGVNARIYDQLLQRLEKAKISQTLEEADKGMQFKLLEPARLPLEPVKPNKPLIILAGFAVGAGLGVVLIYLIELSNNSIRSIDEARRLLQLPIYGAIATINPEELLLGERLRADTSV